MANLTEPFPMEERGQAPLGAMAYVVSRCLLGLLPLAACSDPRDASGSLHPLAVEPLRAQFPRIPYGEARQVQYQLRNRGRAPLRIIRIGPAPCECARLSLILGTGSLAYQVDVDREGVPGGTGVILEPGQEAAVALTLDTSRIPNPESRSAGGFAVYVENEPGLLLEYAADIWSPFLVAPRAIQLGEVGVRERATGVVGIRPHDEKQFFPVVPESVDGWELDLKEHQDAGGFAYHILVRAPAELPLGSFQKDFSLQTNLEGAPPIRFVAQGVAVPDLGVKPATFYLKTDSTGMLRRAEGIIWTRAAEGSFRILGHEFVSDGEPPWGLKAEVVSIEDGRRYRLIVESPAVQADHESTVLALMTDDPETPRLLVTLFWN